MGRISILLLAAVLVAGCTASQVDTIVKATPLVNSFLQQYPNANVSTILVAQGSIAGQLSEIKKDCGADFPLASYYKTNLNDAASNTAITIWMDSKTYKITCALKEVGAIKEIVNPNAPLNATTTTLPPTTTTINETTTTAQPTTTTLNATTTTVNVTTTTLNITTTTLNTTTTTVQNTTTTTVNATTTSSTTTTAPNLPDLYISNKIAGKTNTINVDARNNTFVNYTITNFGSLKSNYTNVKSFVYNTTSGQNVSVYNWTDNLPELSVGDSATFSIYSDNNLGTADWFIEIDVDYKGNNTELNKVNNNVTWTFSTPIS